jgi:hypothetical protein
MKTILNLSLKKDVFEDVINEKTNEIFIEKTNWWRKRLMDLDTGRFKKFDIASISSGSLDKFNYNIESIVLKDGIFVISINRNPVENIESTDINPIIINNEPQGSSESNNKKYVTPAIEIVNSETVSVKKPGRPKKVIDITEPVNDVIVNDNDVSDENPEEKSIKDIISEVFNDFCKKDNVFVVNMPNVTIRTNGQIIGCKKRLKADKDADVKFNFNRMILTKSPSESDEYFYQSVTGFMSMISDGSYVFINKQDSMINEDHWGNIIFTITYVAKKKYIFPKK